jgi:Holliday junction resolvasome RuvABC endonuclease subunit
VSKNYVMGFDAGLANMGWAVFEIGPVNQGLIDFGVICTNKSDVKRKILASDDNVRRAREMWRALKTIVFQYTPKVFCAESQSIPRNAGAASKTAFSWGLLSAAAEEWGDLPFCCESPQRIKKVVAGTMKASKEEVEAAVTAAYPFAAELAVQKKLRKGDREHAFDAAAAVMASLSSDAIRMLRQANR